MVIFCEQLSSGRGDGDRCRICEGVNRFLKNWTEGIVGQSFDGRPLYQRMYNVRVDSEYTAILREMVLCNHARNYVCPARLLARMWEKLVVRFTLAPTSWCRRFEKLDRSRHGHGSQRHWSHFSGVLHATRFINSVVAPA